VLTAVAREAGLDFKVTRTCPGGHAKERQLKTRSGALYCPDCSPHPQPGTTPPQPGAEYLTRRQREARAREAQAGGEAKPERTPLWLLERTAVPVPPHECRPQCNCAEIEAAVSRILQDIGAEPRKEGDMFGRQARAAAREQAAQEARQQAEADALFAEADRWADLAGEPPDFRQEITRERAARIRERLGEDLVRDARAPDVALEHWAISADDIAPVAGEAAPQRGHGSEFQGAERDAEIDRLAATFGEPELWEYGPDVATWGAAEAGPEADSPGLLGSLYPEPEDPEEWPAAWNGLMARSNAAEAARQRENAAATAQRIAAGEQRDNPGPDALAAVMTAGRQLREARAAHVVADATVCAAAARLQEAALEPHGLPRLLDQADAAPRAPEAWRLPDGTPHSDPVLAERGWQAQGGIYRRVPQAQMEAG
jgi:hypothetical protein